MYFFRTPAGYGRHPAQYSGQWLPSILLKEPRRLVAALSQPTRRDLVPSTSPQCWYTVMHTDHKMITDSQHNQSYERYIFCASDILAHTNVWIMAGLTESHWLNSGAGWVINVHRLNQASPHTLRKQTFGLYHYTQPWQSAGLQHQYHVSLVWWSPGKAT